MVEAAGNWGNQLAVVLIGGYQTYLSPRKGWKCAHRVLHGGESCSQWIKTTIGAQGCRAAFPLARTRFAQCKIAAQILRADAHGSQPETNLPKTTTRRDRKGRPRRGTNKSDWCDCCLPHDLPCPPSGCWRFGDAACDCGPGDAGCVDCSSCACFP